MPKLNQIIAIENGVKTQSQKDLTEAHHALMKPQLLSGIARTYRPKDDEGERFPPETVRVQMTANEMLRKSSLIWTRLFDITATKDFANCEAKADIVVDGNKIAEKVPVSYLLFLEKRLNEIETFVKKIPTLDPSETWAFEDKVNCYATPIAQTVKTQKQLRNHTLHDATKEHPAQVQTFTVDVVVGTWDTIKYSGCLPAKVQDLILARVARLKDAVKFAREEANGLQVENRTLGGRLFDYLLAPLDAPVAR